MNCSWLPAKKINLNLFRRQPWPDQQDTSEKKATLFNEIKLPAYFRRHDVSLSSNESTRWGDTYNRASWDHGTTSLKSDTTVLLYYTVGHCACFVTCYFKVHSPVAPFVCVKAHGNSLESTLLSLKLLYFLEEAKLLHSWSHEGLCRSELCTLYKKHSVSLQRAFTTQQHSFTS